MTASDEILLSLDSSDDEQRVIALQFINKSPALTSDGTIQAKIEKLTNANDPAVKFWARKLYAKINSSKQHAEQLPPNEEKSSERDSQLPLDILFQKLHSVKSSYIAIEVIKRIIEANDPLARQSLVTYLETIDDVIIISYLTKQLGIHYPDESMLPVLQKFLTHPDIRVVANTIEGIENIASGKTVVLLSQLLESPHHRVRANAAKALAKQDPVIANQIITKMLQMRDRPHFVIAAMYAIKALKDKRFLGFLEEFSNDPLVGETAQDVISSFNANPPCDAPSASPSGKKSSPSNNLKDHEENAWFASIMDQLLKPFKDLFSAGKSGFLEGFLPIFRTTWKWVFRSIGIVVAIGFVCLLFVGFTKLKDLRPKPAPPPIIPAWQRGIAPEQKNFALAVEELSDEFFGTTNQLKRITYRESIGKKLKDVTQGNLEFSEWIGEVQALQCADPEKVLVVVQVNSPSIPLLFGNWTVRNESFEKNLEGKKKLVVDPEIGSELLIPKESALFKQLTSLEIGEKVKISGKMFRNDETFVSFIYNGNYNTVDKVIEENLKTPKVLVKFTDIRKMKSDVGVFR